MYLDGALIIHQICSWSQKVGTQRFYYKAGLLSPSYFCNMMYLNHKPIKLVSGRKDSPPWRRNLIMCNGIRKRICAFQYIKSLRSRNTRQNQILWCMFIWMLLNPNLQFHSKSDTWCFAWELLIRRSIRYKLLAFAVWCSAGFKEQLIMTLWTHLWNKEMKASYLSCSMTWIDTSRSECAQKNICLLFFNVAKIPLVTNSLAPFLFSSTLAQKKINKKYSSFQLCKVQQFYIIIT